VSVDLGSSWTQESTKLNDEASSFIMYRYMPAKVSQIPKTPRSVSNKSGRDIGSAASERCTVQSGGSDIKVLCSEYLIYESPTSTTKHRPCLRTLLISPISRFCNLDCAVSSIYPSIHSFHPISPQLQQHDATGQKRIFLPTLNLTCSFHPNKACPTWSSLWKIFLMCRKQLFL
jgi:hypothetical protein